MNLSNQSISWIAASLLATTSIFGQQNNKQPQKPFDQGHEVPPSQMIAGYNAPARIDVNGCWDFYVQGSFTYWQAIQENMELGIVGNLLLSPAPGSFVRGIDNSSIVNLDFEYQPGFKVGAGLDFDTDNWDGLVQYTWFRGTSRIRASLDPNNPDLQLFPLQGSAQFAAFAQGNERWRLAMDLLDFELARSEYVGTRLTFRPLFGARVAWIRQKLNIDYTGNAALHNILSRSVNQRSNSWAIGPRAGLQANWLLGCGLRLFGNGSGDLLYTRYTKLVTAETNLVAEVEENVSYPTSISQKKYGCLRTHLELELGLGWGTYFDDNNWHVDLSAGYGFQVFFDQNMFRSFSDDFMIVNSNTPNGNLYVHGLTTTVRFDF